jgi:hypothetical protein
MKTKVFGKCTDTVIIESNGRADIELPAADAIIKLWFSDGTVLGIQYGRYSKLYPNIWHIKILNQGPAAYTYRQLFEKSLLYNSDIYETDAELINYKKIPRTYFHRGIST